MKYYLFILILLFVNQEIYCIASKNDEEKIQNMYLFSKIKTSFQKAKKNNFDLICKSPLGKDNKTYSLRSIQHPKNYQQEEDQVLCWSWHPNKTGMHHILVLLTDKGKQHIKVFYHTIFHFFHKKDIVDFLLSNILHRFFEVKEVIPLLVSGRFGCKITEDDIKVILNYRNGKTEKVYLVTKVFYNMKNGYDIKHSLKIKYSLKGEKIEQFWSTHGEDMLFKSYPFLTRIQLYLERFHHESIKYAIRKDMLPFFKFLVAIKPVIRDEYWSLFVFYERFAFLKFLKEAKDLQFPISYEQEYLLLRYRFNDLSKEKLISILKSNKELFYHCMDGFKQNFLMATLDYSLYGLAESLLETFGEEMKKRKLFSDVDVAERNLLLIAVDSRGIKPLTRQKMKLTKEKEFSAREKSSQKLNAKQRYKFLKKLLTYPVNVNQLDKTKRTAIEHAYFIYQWSDYLSGLKADDLKTYKLLKKAGGLKRCELAIKRCKDKYHLNKKSTISKGMECERMKDYCSSVVIGE